MQNFPNVEHSLLTVLTLCDNGHTVDFSEKNCVVKKNMRVIGIADRTGGIYSVELWGVDEESMVTSKVSEVDASDLSLETFTYGQVGYQVNNGNKGSC